MKKQMKSMISAVAAVIMVFVLTACGSQGQEGSSSEDLDDGKGGEYKVGITVPDLANPHYAALVQSFQSAAKEKGYSVSEADGAGDVSKQVTQIENFIQKGMDVIVLAAVEANGVQDITRQAMDEGIKIISYSTVIENFDTEFLVDPQKTGYACGKAAADWINENYPDEEVEWAMIDLPEIPEIIERANGIIQGVEENAPNAKLVNQAAGESSEVAMSAVENFLQANPDIKVVCAIGSGGGIGANEAFKSVTDEYDKVGVFSIDAGETEVMNILNGDPQKATISLGGPKKHGEMMADYCEKLINGEEVEETNYTPIDVIDISNAQEYYDESLK